MPRLPTGQEKSHKHPQTAFQISYTTLHRIYILCNFLPPIYITAIIAQLPTYSRNAWKMALPLQSIQRVCARKCVSIFGGANTYFLVIIRLNINVSLGVRIDLFHISDHLKQSGWVLLFLVKLNTCSRKQKPVQQGFLILGDYLTKAAQQSHMYFKAQ